MRQGTNGIIGFVLAAALVVPAAAHADFSGLVAAYGFEEAGGTSAVDASPSGNTGTLNGATRSTAGKFGHALSFDGSNDRVDVADAGSLDLSAGMTLEAWVDPTAASSSWRTVLLKEQPAGLAYALYSDEGTARPSGHVFTSREYDTRGTAAAELGAWSHLAATYDGATLRLYVNGTQVSSRALTGALKTTSGALRIGGNAIWGEYFEGMIDEVRVYNRALTAGEIAADMATPVVPAYAPPSAPTDLRTTVAQYDVNLFWTAPGSGLSANRVYRSTTSGFTPDASNLIATVSGGWTNYIDWNRPAGTYYYRVVAVDAAGNAGPPSNEASATVLPDTTPPAVAITGECPRTVSGIADIFGTRSDDSGNPPRVELRLDGTHLVDARSTWSGGFDGEWDTVFTPNGTYTLTAVARDAAGNETTSAPCEVTVDNPALSIAFAAPEDGATVAGTVMLRAQAASDGVPYTSYNIQYRVDGVKVGLLSSSYGWDTTGLANGSVHALTAELHGNYADDPPYATTTIHVTVDNSPESVPPTAPSNLAAAVSDDDVQLTWDRGDRQCQRQRVPRAPLGDRRLRAERGESRRGDPPHALQDRGREGGHMALQGGGGRCIRQREPAVRRGHGGRRAGHNGADGNGDEPVRRDGGRNRQPQGELE